MKTLTKKQKIQYLGLSALAGFLFFTFNFLLTPFAFLLIAFFVYHIHKSKNKNGEAHLFAAFMLGIEPLVRSAKSGSVPYEYGKYAIVILLLAGIFFEENRMKYNYKLIFYFIFMLPACLFIEPELLKSVSDEATDNIRKIILFNLSGPLCLMVSLVYFYSRKFSILDFERLIFFSIASLVIYVVFLQFKVMSYGEIIYSAWGSNTKSSGGFAANQVALAMGIGILMLLVSIYLQKPVSGYLWVDLVLLSFFTYRGLLTFSRGGIIVAMVAFIIPMFFYLKNSKIGSKTKKTMGILTFTSVVLYIVWISINKNTGGQLTKRYEGESGSFEATGKRQILTDRDKIAIADLSIFMSYPITGVGPGMGIYYRTTHGYDKAVAAHVEFTRVLAEHGILGLFSLLLLTGALIRSFGNHKSVIGRTVCIVFIVFGIMTLGHNCMRTAAGAFTIGLGTIVLLDKDRVKKQISNNSQSQNGRKQRLGPRGLLLDHWVLNRT